MDDELMRSEKYSIKDDINTNLKEFALYTVYNRAIPSAIDGFKTTQRKILYAMLQYPNPTKNKVKLADLGSISRFNYHHAESAAQQTAVGMAQSWANNAPIFDGHGNFGSRKVQAAAAPRYIFATLSKNYEKYFTDSAVCPQSDDPDNPEPRHYLPIIPWVLVNGVSGVATGFATKILPRDPDTLVSTVKKIIKNRKYDSGIIPPKFPDFKGTVDHVEGLTWKIRGIVSEEGSFGYKITEVPYGEDRAGYVSILNDLCDKNIIQDYDDNCSDKGFEFFVKVSKAQKEEIKAKDPIKVFKLERQVTENLTMIGHDGKIKIFDDIDSVIKYFVEYRVTKVAEGIALDISKLEHRLKVAEDKMKFIKACIDGKVKFGSVKKQELLDFIEKNITSEEYGRDFVNIPIYNLTEDMVSALELSVDTMVFELSKLREEPPEHRYLEMLKSTQKS